MKGIVRVSAETGSCATPDLEAALAEVCGAP